MVCSTSQAECKKAADGPTQNLWQQVSVKQLYRTKSQSPPSSPYGALPSYRVRVVIGAHKHSALLFCTLLHTAGAQKPGASSAYGTAQRPRSILSAPCRLARTHVRQAAGAVPALQERCHPRCHRSSAMGPAVSAPLCPPAPPPGPRRTTPPPAAPRRPAHAQQPPATAHKTQGGRP
jgi:hypothetical protein